MLKYEQIDLPLVHEFAPGVYMRTIFMPAGSVVIGKTHRTQHFNIIHTGSAIVVMDGVKKLVKAPDMFQSGPGVKKILRILEDMTWSTVHTTKKRDLIMDNGQINIDATVNRLEPKLVLSFDEERRMIESELKTLEDV